MRDWMCDSDFEKNGKRLRTVENAGSGERIRTSDLRVISLVAICKIITLGPFYMNLDVSSGPICIKNVSRLFAFFHALFALWLVHHS